MSLTPPEPKPGNYGEAETGRYQAPPPPPEPSRPPAGRSYNKGSGEDLRKALDAISDYNKTLITIATGTVALTATFLKDLYHGHSINFVVAAWIVLGVSVLAGMISMGDYISQYAETDLRPRRGVAEYASLVQLLCVLTGLGLFGYFAVQNATA
jgi:hypothetical protein